MIRYPRRTQCALLVVLMIILHFWLTPSQAHAHSAAHAGTLDWSGWSLDWSVPDSYEGLTLSDVSFQGHRILNKASLPVMLVFYDNDECGPYADRLGGTLLPVSWHNNAEVVTRTFVQNGTAWLELGIQDKIGDYIIYQVWYLSEDGILDAHIFSKGLQCNTDHVHYPYWRMDFDLDGSADDGIFALQDGAWQRFTSEFDASATAALNHQWEVRDTTTGLTVRIEPGSADWSLPGNNISVADQTDDNFLFGRVYRSAEDRGWMYGANLTYPGNNGESLLGNDIILTYKGRMWHSAAEGQDLWHSAGPRFVIDLSDNAAPSADFISTPSDQLRVNFDAANSSDSDGTIVSYAWSFGDGTTGSGQSVSHLYDEAGSYRVTLTVTDNDGAVATISQSVVVGTALAIDVELLASHDTLPPSGATRELTVRVTNNSAANTWQTPIQVTQYVDSIVGELAPNPTFYEQTCFWWLPELWPGQSWECQFNADLPGGIPEETLFSSLSVAATTDAGHSLFDSATMGFSVIDRARVQSLDAWRADPNRADYYMLIDTDADGTADTNGVLIGDFNRNGVCDSYEIWWSASCIALTQSEIGLLLATSTPHSDERINLTRQLTAAWLNIQSENDYRCAGIDIAIHLANLWLHDHAPNGNPLAGGTAVPTSSSTWESFSWSADWLAWYNGGDSCAVARSTYPFFTPQPLVDAFSAESQQELKAILYNDGALRQQLNQLTRMTVRAVMLKEPLAAAHIAQVEAVYDALMAHASEPLATELSDLWWRSGLKSAENQAADVVWQALWQPLAPTATQLIEINLSKQNTEPFIIVAILLAVQSAVYLRTKF